MIWNCLLEKLTAACLSGGRRATGLYSCLPCFATSLPLASCRLVVSAYIEKRWRRREKNTKSKWRSFRKKSWFRIEHREGPCRISLFKENAKMIQNDFFHAQDQEEKIGNEGKTAMHVFATKIVRELRREKRRKTCFWLKDAAVSGEPNATETSILPRGPHVGHPPIREVQFMTKKNNH